MTTKQKTPFDPANAKGFAKPTAKSDRPPTSQPEPTPQPTATSTAIPTAREGAIALAATSYEAMSALESAGLQNAAAYVQRKQAERNLVI